MLAGKDYNMKKSVFTASMLSVVGVLLLGLGMCMCTIAEWNLFRQGVLIGCAGLLVFLLAVLLYRRMEHKPPVRCTRKGLFGAVIFLIGIMGFGIGMCLSMVYDQMLLGVCIGIVGIAVLMTLIPVCAGLK